MDNKEIKDCREFTEEGFRAFVETVAKNVQRCLGGEYTVNVKAVGKNNGVKRAGLTARKGRANVAPVVYLEECYQHYVDGKPMQDICNGLADIFRKDVKFEGAISFIRDFNAVKERLFCRLLNAEKNREMLKESPFKWFLDLREVAYIHVTVEDGSAEDGFIRVTNALMRAWGISRKELFAYAEKNTQGLGATAEPMSKVVGEIVADGSLPEGEEGCTLWEGWNPPMYVARNASLQFGAVVMLDDKFLQSFSDKVGGNFYILPSSVHELIFLPEDGQSAEELRVVVRETNQNVLFPDDILSDNVYLYNKLKGRVEIASC